MTGTKQAQLEQMKRELQGIIQSLEGQQARLENGFSGIGTEYCARAVEMAQTKCRLAKKMFSALESIV